MREDNTAATPVPLCTSLWLIEAGFCKIKKTEVCFALAVFAAQREKVKQVSLQLFHKHCPSCWFSWISTVNTPGHLPSLTLSLPHTPKCFNLFTTTHIHTRAWAQHWTHSHRERETGRKEKTGSSFVCKIQFVSCYFQHYGGKLGNEGKWFHRDCGVKRMKQIPR